MTPIPNLSGRLACACNLAYAVNGSDVLGQYATIPDYLSAGGLPADSVIIHDGTWINVCRIWESADGIVLAFRGTLPPLPDPDPVNDLQSLADWVQDGIIILEDVAWLAAPGARVHVGFANALETIWPELVTAVNTISANTGKTRLFFTGHSKGGALAALGALRWVLEQGPATPVQVATFGAPRVGNRAFASFYNGQPMIEHERFEFGHDLVTHLPLSDSGIGNLVANAIGGGIHFPLVQDYEHVGPLRYFDWNGQSRPDTPMLVQTRFLAFIRGLAESPIQLIIHHFVWSTKGRPGYLTCVSPPGYWE